MILYLSYMQFWVNTDNTSFQFHYFMFQTKKPAVTMWCYNQLQHNSVTAGRAEEAAVSVR